MVSTFKVDYLDAVRREETDDCRPWPWAKNPKGYGQVWDGTSAVLVSHLALIRDGRPRPADMIALHSCDNPPCCNPRHLRWGTPAENTAQMMARGRGVAPTGLRNGRARLTDQQIDDLRRRRAAGETCAEVAAALGVTSGYVSRVSRGLRRGV